MPAIKGILFDKDGVFVDFEKTWTAVLKDIALHLADGNSEASNILLEVAGYDSDTNSFLPGSVWAAGHSGDLLRAWAPFLEGMTREQIERIVTDHCLEAVPQPVLPADEQKQVFEALKAMGFYLGVATNDFRRSAVRTIEIFQLNGLFDLVLGFDSVENPKPDGDPIIHFAEAMSIETSQVMMVGDNEHDVACGRSGGAGLCVGVTSGNSPREILVELADHVLEDISGLPALVAQLNKN